MKKTLIAVLALSSFSALAQTTPAPANNTCAIVFTSQETECASKLVIKAGQSLNDLNQVHINQGRDDWDNKISKVLVKKGCTFVGYQYQDFNMDYNTHRPLDGFAQTMENNSSVHDFKIYNLDSSTNHKISSLKCFCL